MHATYAYLSRLWTVIAHLTIDKRRDNQTYPNSRRRGKHQCSGSGNTILALFVKDVF